MVDPGLTQGMVEWVTGHTLRYHLDIDHWVHHQGGDWSPICPPLASQRNVTVLGLGELGTACAKTLASLGFNVTGWARRAKQIDGITCLHDAEGLEDALSTAEILILLLPDTPATTNLLNANTLDLLPKGARICTMDARGKRMSSPEFAQQMARLSDDGAGDLAFIIGGADGIDPSLRSRADMSLSFGKMVWPHMLARVMLSEQLYRAASILAGSPYHRV